MPPTAITHINTKSESLHERKDLTLAPKDDEYGFLPQQRYTQRQLMLARIIFLLTIYISYLKTDNIQEYIDQLWDYVQDKWWFQTVYFETLLVVVYSFPSTLTFQIMDKIPFFDKYRIEPKGGRIVSENIPDLIRHSIEYILPLALLDTFHVKHYHGVSDDVILKKRENWIQRTRALPDFSPRLRDMVIHIFIAIVVYDALFFTIHYNLHKNPTLYRIFHKKHHTHDVINAKATDHQHWVERVAFILCANAGLKVQGAHPLTRMIFVFVFINTLLYTHGGYDFPWTLDKIVPGRIFSGARQHYVHHTKGKRYYQFIFTYLDNGLDWWSKRHKVNKSS